jgi:hypothetical protein
MSSITDRLISKGLISPPGFLKANVHYEVMMGSIAYGCSNDTSDVDVYGFCIPPKDIIFPHLKGVIQGFDKQVQSFEQFQKHHVTDKDTEKEYDLLIYNIVKYFRLVMDNNPNMLDSLFVPRRCVLYSSRIGEMVREKRKLFLHKGSFHKLKGYAYSQLHKMRGKSILEFVEFCDEHGLDTSITMQDVTGLGLSPTTEIKLRHILKRVDTNNRTKRLDSIKEFGLDVKFAYHIVRLINQAEQILNEHDLDLTKSREQLKSIRRGEWSADRVQEYFERREAELEKVYESSTLPHSPDQEAIKVLLLNCLEEHFGSLDKAIVTDNKIVDALRQIQDISNIALRFIK